MLSPSAAALLTWVLFAHPAAAESPAFPECTEAILRVELRAESPAQPPVVCLSSGQDTVVRLDASLRPNGVVLSGGRPLEWSASQTSLTVYAPADLAVGSRFSLTLLYAGAEAPQSVSLELVAHPARATRQVQVFRHARPLADLVREVQEARTEAAQCRADKARVEAACTAHRGLLGVLAGRKIPAHQFRAQNIRNEVKLDPRNALGLTELVAYRAAEQVALAVVLGNPGSEPWTAEGMELKSTAGTKLDLFSLQQAPSTAPGEDDRLLRLGADLPEGAPPGPYTLKLWDASGRHVVIIENITFP